LSKQSLEKWKTLISQKEKIDKAIKRIFETLIKCIDSPDLVRSKDVILIVDEAIVDIQSGLGFLFGFIKSNQEKLWMEMNMKFITRFHTKKFNLYAHFNEKLEKEHIEKLLKWARIILPRIGNVSIQPETLEVSIPEVKMMSFFDRFSDYSSEIIIGVVSAVVSSAFTITILKLFF
jgi:hypothetical protein